MSIISPPQKIPKHPQTIWLETQVMAKILQLSSELKVAPNVVIAEIVKKYFENDTLVKVVKECPYGKEAFEMCRFRKR